MADVVKDIGEIWTRLFDHRPFLHGEIEFFIREFEGKRSDREIDSLFKILENVTDIKDSQIDKLKLSSETHLPRLQLAVDSVLDKCENILAREEEFKKDNNIDARREERKLVWENFVEDMSSKCEKVDKTFQQKENDIEDYYKHLQIKLNIPDDS